MVDTSKIEFLFNGYDRLKEDFIQKIKAYPQIFNGFSFNQALGYSYVVSIVKGNNSDLFKKVSDTFFQTSINLYKYTEGISKKNADITYKNFNGFTIAHEQRILDKIKNDSNGSFVKLINRLKKFLKELNTYEYAYNKVYYIDYYK